jgi:nicotinamidase/pyrazinamidase
MAGGIVISSAVARAGVVAAQGGGTPSGAAPSGGKKMKPGERDVLLVVDVQNDFIPGGALPVKDGDQVIAVINRLAPAFARVVITQDWHTPGHVSFASSHPGKKPFDTIELPYGTQVLWPDHCVQGTPGAALHKDLSIPHAELIIRKGYRKQIDSYSAFLEADRRTHTGLAGYLKERGLRNVYLVGLATDFCVGWSAIDARAAGFTATVVQDACRGIDANGSLAKAWDSMKKVGVKRIQSSELEAPAT